MSWTETWLDTAIAPSLDICKAAAIQAGARVFNIYLGGRYSYQGGGGWTAMVHPLQSAGFEIFGTWVSLSPGQGGYPLGHQDGVDAVTNSQGLNLLCYDIEPSTWKYSPGLVTDAMNGFRDAVHEAGRQAMIYGLQDTLAAAAGYDRFWGTFDLASIDPGRSAGKPGSRALQYVQAQFAGVTWDVSHSEFTVGDTMTPEEHNWLLGLYDLLINGNPQTYSFQGQGWAKVGIDQLLALAGGQRDKLTTVQATLDAVKATLTGFTPSSALTPAQAQQLTEMHDALVRIETSLRQA